MKNHTIKTKEPRFPVKNLKNEIQVNISPNVLKEIKYLNHKISNVEWSGILFYSTIGEITDIENFSITLESIYPMDKGSSGYTEFETSEDFIGYRMDNPETLQWKIGLIHSHNTMKAFFSGTDMDEINVTARYHNMYLSIVVNNMLDIVGKLAFVANTSDPLTYTYRGINGKKETIKIKNEQKALFVYDCKLELENIIVDDKFKDLVDNIIKKSVTPITTYHNGYSKFDNKNVKNPFGDRQLSLPLSKFNNGKRFEDDGMGFEDENENEMWEDIFPTFWLSFGDIDSENKTADTVLKEINSAILKGEVSTNYLDELIDNTYDLYQNYFAGSVLEVSYIEALETTYDYFEIFIEKYPFIKNLMHTLELMIVELNNKHLEYGS
jgi:hypothetical protein